MANVKVILDQKKCTGAASCVLKNPELFSLVGKKASLNQGLQDGSFMIAESSNKKKSLAAARACPSNAIRILENDKDLVKTKISIDAKKIVSASYDEKNEWVMDRSGYFLIRLIPEKSLIEVGHCTSKNVIDVVVSGSSATEIYNTLIRLKLVSSLQHAAYLGKELYKAKVALKLKKKYVQDDSLFNEKYD